MFHCRLDFDHCAPNLGAMPIGFLDRAAVQFGDSYSRADFVFD
jgi:hypothetical protein